MNCTVCSQHSCRRLEPCGGEAFDRLEALEAYKESSSQAIVQASAVLVDGRAGELSRWEEILEFFTHRGYRRLGLAYCWGLEGWAKALVQQLKVKGIPVSAVSCTVGAHSQTQINESSPLAGVSCNPISQARQLMAEGVDFALQVGLCLGHDILFTREFKGDQTTLVVKDRKWAHQPQKGFLDEAVNRS